MAITASNLTFGENSVGGVSSQATASISPTSNNLVIVGVSGGTTTQVPTLSGASMTWVEIAHIGDADFGQHIVTLFRGLAASPGTGALTIDFAGVNQNRISWTVDQFSGTDITGTNGSGAVVQSATFGSSSVTNSSETLNLAALGSANNAAYGFIFNTGLSTIVAGTGFTELSNNNGDGEFESEWAINKTAVAWTWASESSNYTDCVAIEIKASVAVATRNYIQAPYSLMPDPAW